MKNKWSDEDAALMVREFAAQGAGTDIALRVYSSRLIGMEPHLVIHGGGNTSVKTRIVDFLGREREVLCVKGSGRDLSTIKPEGLPALDLAALRLVRSRSSLNDEEMIAFLRSNLIEAGSPDPSVETLLHAFLPHKFVDHSHATAILALSDQRRGEEITRDVLGERVKIIPYVMPGFRLAKAVAEAYEAAPDAEGVILSKHGLFTFGETARQSYDRMIALVSRAEDHIARSRTFSPMPRRDLSGLADVEDIAPIIRGAASIDAGEGVRRRFIVEFRTSDAIRRFVDGENLREYGARGVITPDHVIRTKNHYLLAPVAHAAELSGFRRDVWERVSDYKAAYDSYFETQNERAGGGRRRLDSSPRVVLAPGVGLFGLGSTRNAARIAADLAEISIDAVSAAERIGAFEPLPSEDIFDVEYWSLEQAKLGKGAPKPLEGQIAVITGGAGTIGAAAAKLFAANGAAVALLDLDAEKAKAAAGEIGDNAIGAPCDVTDDESSRNAFRAVVRAFGGVDILISNAGAAFEGAIAELDDATLRRSFELNFFAHQRMAKLAVSIMKAQGTGGALLFNVSKQAINPGENFGAYGTPKAATLFLVRQYALECGRFGIRANAVNADRIRSGMLDDKMIERRSKARGLTPEQYLGGNLLGLEVSAQDVAQAFLHQALSLKSTGGVTTVDGGNVAAMLR